MYSRDDKGKIKNTRGNQYAALYVNGYAINDIAKIMKAKSTTVRSSLASSPHFNFKELTPAMQPRPYNQLTPGERELLKEYKTAMNRIVKGEEPPKTKKKTSTAKKGVIKPKAKPEEPVQPRTLGETLTAPFEVRQEVIHEYNQTQAQEYYEGGHHCGLCQGRGWIVEPTAFGSLEKTICPACLGKSKIIVNGLSSNEKENVLAQLIPNKLYRENNFNHEHFYGRVPLPEEERGESFERYEHFMDEILAGINEGMLPKKSYYVAAPDHFGKKWFAYEIIKTLVRNDFKTTGIQSVLKLANLVENNNYNELNAILDTDMLLVNLSGSRRVYLAHVYQFILEEADSRGIPVMMFSRVQARTLINPTTGIQGGIYSHTEDYQYGRLQEEGLKGEEFKKALEYSINQSQEEVGVTQSSNNTRKIRSRRRGN